MLFNHVVKLMPKSLLAIKEHIAHVNANCCAYLEASDTASCMTTSSVSTANCVEPATQTSDQKNQQILMS